MPDVVENQIGQLIGPRAAGQQGHVLGKARGPHIDAELVARGSDVYRQYTISCSAYVAGDASSEQVFGFLAESARQQSEEGSIGALHCCRRSHIIRSYISPVNDSFFPH